ncbi:Pfs, NACHT, and Ankyrin domain protein [Pochonia chlamydosporia 170]|uniref:Pfs, NACHT, and Ankyrin domain protein n=1 Tax=Pochonia chlamydosporia 170 TaxID=1380566 RepID=A0A219ANK0_METCM|nr:Pfs, NACHT, and Ankyrin domain protein [Pochonia chlamydosporia 170]OWT42418.1 Pfs, NACHT, and Ankyrin domain protein [Pochonia chlamydosporia 170]
MEWIRAGLITLLAGVASIACLWFLGRNNHRSKSGPQPQAVQEHPTDESPPEKKENRVRQRLTILYPEQTENGNDDAEVDIVAVHGLGSDVDWSWTYKDGERQINWLRDPNMLPAKVPKSRIIVYSYESRWHADAPKTRLQLCGEELVHSVHSFRHSVPNRPLVFVGHSLGGNVILQALLYANEDDKYACLPKATVGLVFLGTPFRGSKWQPFLNALAQLMGPAGSHRGITRELGFDEPELRDKLHRFCKLRNKLSTSVSCFSELRETNYGRRFGIAGVAKVIVVDEASACIPGLDRYALDKDHLKINKFQGPTDPSFERVSGVISEMCRGAKDIVRRRHERRTIITDNSVALRQKPEAGACLGDLFVTDPLEDKKVLKRKKGDRAHGTCEWILGTEDLTAWLRSSHTKFSESQTTHVLWLHGNPGTGKSTLAIFLTDALSTDFSATDANTLAYFFCDSAFDTRKTATSIIRGLLLQLVQQHPQLLNYVLPKYNERKTKLFDSFDALWTIFMAAAADQDTGKKYCIIDALDECDLESQKTLLQQLRETFQRPDAPPNVRILVTSRPYPEIREYLDVFANKDLAAFPEAKQDIGICIEERVTELGKRKKYTDKVKRQVSDILRDKAEGTFLWVGIACNELEDVPSKNAVAHLERIPRGLHSIYERLLDTALEREGAKDVIRLILGFVAVSLRPLSLLELSEACQLHPDEEDTETRIQFMRECIESCHLIVVIQDEKVLLLHQSVKDYLITASEKACFSEFEAHAQLAYRCVDHLIGQFHNRKQGHSHLSKYAALKWPNHARMAQSRFEVRASEAEFFEIDSPCREHWLTSFPLGTLMRRPGQFSILHVAAAWGIPSIAEYASRSYDQPHKLIRVADASGATPLESAALSGYPSLVRLLLDMGAEVTARVTEAAVRSYQNSRGVITLLLDQRGGEVIITEEVVKAAAERGEEVMALLLERRGDEITITDEVVKAAAGNWFNGEEMMALLLQRRGDEITITDEVVKAVAGNHNGKEVMALLLDRRGDEVNVTDEVVKAAASNEENGKEVMELLLDRRGDEITVTEEVGMITITEEVVKAAAAYNGKELMTLLLERRGDEVTITEEVVKAAAGNRRNGKEVMALLLDPRGDEVTITDEVVCIIAKSFDEKVMSLLLDRRGDDIIITNEVVKAAAGNYYGKDVMGLLLERRGDKITITNDVVKVAAGNFYGEEVMALLLDRRGDEITITDEVSKAAASNEDNGKEVMALLLDRCGGEITITHEVQLAAATCGQEGVLMLLSQKGFSSVRDEWRCIAQFYNAAKAGDVSRVEQLLHSGTKPDTRNIRGKHLYGLRLQRDGKQSLKFWREGQTSTSTRGRLTGNRPYSGRLAWEKRELSPF